MPVLYNKNLTDYQHINAAEIYHASQVRVIPNATQNLIAKYYGIDPFMLTDVNCVCDAKCVYAYVLVSTRSFESVYDCADEAGVSYPNLQSNNAMLDRERNANSVFGRHLDFFISSHKNSLKNV